MSECLTIHREGNTKHENMLCDCETEREREGMGERDGDRGRETEGETERQRERAAVCGGNGGDTSCLLLIQNSTTTHYLHCERLRRCFFIL